ncbi:DHH family phosphoesterase [Candidatus Woesearchaeota archaeon]|nr:DHH family phosphoesterase [Candidatus Woesearchaeota archaeon]
MEIKDTKTFNRFLSWVKKGKENCLVIHDVDGDGLSSAKILMEGLKRAGKPIKYRFAAYDRTRVFGDFVIEFVKNRKISAIITCDINLLSTNFHEKKEFFRDKTIIVFDHHETPTHIDENMIYLHPKLLYGFPEPSQYCTTKLVYDVVSTLVDLHDLDWVASIGIVADASYPTWKEFVDATLTGLSMRITASPFDSELQKVGTYLYYALATDKVAAENGVKIYMSAKDYTEALQGLEQYKIVEKEIQYYLQNWEKYAERSGDIVFIKIEPKYKINSLLSSQISHQFPSKTIIVGSPKKDPEKPPEFMGFSLRRQDGKVNLPALLKEMSQHLEMNGGGHIPASGAHCKIADYPQFKEWFVKLYQKHKTVEHP